ncbi:hypothetical protein ACW73L_07465 [Methylolobus aquaticus]
MIGWKTYTAGGAAIVFGVYLILDGQPEQGANRIIEGLAIVGIGHKLDRAAG